MSPGGPAGRPRTRVVLDVDAPPPTTPDGAFRPAACAGPWGTAVVLGQVL
jgi:hypothetical protein